MFFRYFMIISPLERAMALHLNKLESPSLKDAWLKLAQWYWRRSKKCEKFTDRRTDAARLVIRKAYLSFQLR